MNYHRATNSTIVVRKRDGTNESFVISKLLNCIQNGLTAGGETCGLNLTAAGGLAEAVFEYLQSSYSASPVPSRHLAELVELVLCETGHASASMAIRQHAAHREFCRRRILVATPRPSDGRFAQRRWNKSLLVQHFRRCHQLDAPTARMMAGRVEELVFNCGLRVVTTGFVREAARSELLAWGLMPGALVVKRSYSPRGPGSIKES
ncbi:MAG: hypothetical protein HS101_13375 [Planctomycetia bacterium]|jgi:hypothetical protein|nr:hypothetical protein [Planctomycetia bacterium]MCC7314681.1 hypothetical protein [Planctomycetota bacterium]